MKSNSSIDPMRGVVNPDSLKTEIKKLSKGSSFSRSYVRGALTYLKRKPPNKHIVPLLEKALEKYS